MGNSRKSRIAPVLLLLFAGAACKHAVEDKQLAALDSAYHAGVITQSEYEAKKSALASLAALDKARDAGLLTPDEYQARKQRLASALPAAPTVADAAPMTPVSTAAASTAAVPISTAAPSGGVREDHIFDAHLNLNAFDVRVPANWKFDGMYVAGSSCIQIPFPVFRMYSPDGLTEIRRLPRFDWRWTTSKFKPQDQGDCLDLQQELSAQDFTKYLMGVMQVAYVRDFPIPQELRDQLQKNVDQANANFAASAAQFDKTNASLPSMKGRPKMQPMTQKQDISSVLAEYRNGTFMIDEQIWVRTTCTHTPINFGPDAGGSSDSCSATVRLLRAPKGQLDALLARVEADKIGATDNMEWIQKYMAEMQAKAKAMSDKMFADSNARMRAQHDEFERGQAVRAQQHQQFLATMKEGTDRSMARANQAANSRHAIAQDWCDYALDRQTVTGAGGTVKISNAYSQTWTDGSGNYYQTNDPNANPNGVLKGNWSQTTQVHGDGTAK